MSKRKKDRKIWVVPRVQIRIGERLHAPPPDREISRARVYAIALPLTAAATMAKNGHVAPAHPDDAAALVGRGVQMIPHYRGLRPGPVDESEESADGAPDPALLDYIADALDSGLKADLVAALEAAGLEPSDYANNGERAAALEGKLEELAPGDGEGE